MSLHSQEGWSHRGCRTELLDVPSAPCKGRGDEAALQSQPAPLPSPAATSLRSPQPLAELLCRRRKITRSCVCASLQPLPAQPPAPARCPHAASSSVVLWEKTGNQHREQRFQHPPSSSVMPQIKSNPVWWCFGQTLLFLRQGSKQGMIQERGSRAKAPRGTREQELLSVQGTGAPCPASTKTKQMEGENKVGGR